MYHIVNNIVCGIAARASKRMSVCTCVDMYEW